jgi:hypothetical protein
VDELDSVRMRASTHCVRQAPPEREQHEMRRTYLYPSPINSASALFPASSLRSQIATQATACTSALTIPSPIPARSQPDPSHAASHQRDSVFQYAQVKRFLEISYLRTSQSGVDGGVSFSGIAVRLVSHGGTKFLESSSGIALSQVIAHDKPGRQRRDLIPVGDQQHAEVPGQYRAELVLCILYSRYTS